MTAHGPSSLRATIVPGAFDGKRAPRDATVAAKPQ
jgi:hypothetical protein